jgi:hypothetical protein
MVDRDFFIEKNGIEEKVIDAPPSEVEHGIIKDWDKEESAIRRKYVALNLGCDIWKLMS